RQVTPWVFMETDTGLEVRTFSGKAIRYRGIRFEGSPRQVFWAGYIEPFLEDLVVRELDSAFTLSAERAVDPAEVLGEVKGLLIAATKKVYEQMAAVDRRLRGHGFPDQCKRTSVQGRIEGMERF